MIKLVNATAKQCYLLRLIFPHKDHGNLTSLIAFKISIESIYISTPNNRVLQLVSKAAVPVSPWGPVSPCSPLMPGYPFKPRVPGAPGSPFITIPLVPAGPRVP